MPAREKTPGKSIDDSFLSAFTEFPGRVVLLHVILLIAAGALVYSNSLTGEFIWDDEVLVVRNAFIKNWKFAGQIFTQPMGVGGGFKYPYYRPLLLLSYAVDYSFWKLNPTGYHASNLVYHILAALCIYCLVTQLSRNRWLAFLAGLVFTVHPVQTEAVAYISGRNESLALIFIILSALFYIKSINLKKVHLSVTASLFFVLALLSKEASVILPALLIMYHFSFKKKVIIKFFFPICIIAAAFFMLRFVILGNQAGNAWIITAHQRIPGIFAALVNYIKILLVPVHLHIEYGDKLFSPTDPVVLFGLVLAVLLLVAAFRSRKADGLVTFSILWFFTALLPVSNLYPVFGYMAERYLYIPFLGFALLVAAGMQKLYRLWRSKYLAVMMIAVLIIFCSLLTWKQNSYWNNVYDFNRRTLRYTPDSWRSYAGLGNVLKKRGLKREALRQYLKAVDINPTDDKLLLNLGDVCRELGLIDKARFVYEKALAIELERDENAAFALHNLGVLYKELGQNENARALFDRAVEIDPFHVETYIAMADMHNSAGEKIKALAVLTQALELDPDRVTVLANMGTACYDLGRMEESYIYYSKAAQIDPKNYESHYNLGIVYYDLGHKEQAVESFQRALELNPRHAEAHYNLAIILYKEGQIDSAFLHFKKSVELGYAVPEHIIDLINRMTDDSGLDNQRRD